MKIKNSETGKPG